MGALATALEGLVVVVQALVLLLIAPIRALVPKRTKDVAGEVVLITGGGMGMGRLMALDFAKRDATVVLWDINDEAMQDVIEEIKQLGKSQKAHAYVVDVTKREDVYETAAKVRQNVGDVTILINNAGLVNGKPLLATADKRIELLMDVNTTAHFWTIKAFLPSMVEKDHGHIVTLASSAGLFPVSGMVDYCCSKFAAVGLHDSLSLELVVQGKMGIQTTLICPYLVNTGMFDGAGSRFSWLIPPLEPSYAVQRIMHAVLTNEKRLLMPRILNIFAVLKEILPFEAAFMVAKYLGITSFADNIRGRQVKAE